MAPFAQIALPKPKVSLISGIQRGGRPVTKKISTPKSRALLKAETVRWVIRSYEETMVPSKSVAITLGRNPVMPEEIGQLLRMVVTR